VPSFQSITRRFRLKKWCCHASPTGIDLGRAEADAGRTSTELQEALGDQAFYEFLESHQLLSLVGLLQYGYEVQGYGGLTNIPAYYGLDPFKPPLQVRERPFARYRR